MDLTIARAKQEAEVAFWRHSGRKGSHAGDELNLCIDFLKMQHDAESCGCLLTMEFSMIVVQKNVGQFIDQEPCAYKSSPGMKPSIH